MAGEAEEEAGAIKMFLAEEADVGASVGEELTRAERLENAASPKPAQDDTSQESKETAKRTGTSGIKTPIERTESSGSSETLTAAGSLYDLNGDGVLSASERAAKLRGSLTSTTDLNQNGLAALFAIELAAGGAIE